MADVTDNYGWPFPELTDEANGPQQIQALAVAADATVKLIEDGAGGIPAGAMLDFAGAAAPTGYLLCDGTSYLRATYPALFTAIGVAYGSADGTHFNVPDFRGRVAVGLGTHADVDALADSDGLAVGSRRPKHKSSVVQPTIGITDPGHTHLGTQRWSGAGSSVDGYPGYNASSSNLSSTASGQQANKTTGITATATGGTVGPQTGSEPTDAPAYLVCQKIIKN